MASSSLVVSFLEAIASPFSLHSLLCEAESWPWASASFAWKLLESLCTLSVKQQISKNPWVLLWSIKLEQLEGVTALSETILQNGKNRHTLQSINIYDYVELEEILMQAGLKRNSRILQHFVLRNCPHVRKITWAGVIPGVLFRNITYLHIGDWQSLKNVTWIRQLPYLEIFWLRNC